MEIILKCFSICWCLAKYFHIIFHTVFFFQRFLYFRLNTVVPWDMSLMFLKWMEMSWISSDLPLKKSVEPLVSRNCTMYRIFLIGSLLWHFAKAKYALSQPTSTQHGIKAIACVFLPTFASFTESPPQCRTCPPSTWEVGLPMTHFFTPFTSLRWLTLHSLQKPWSITNLKWKPQPPRRFSSRPSRPETVRYKTHVLCNDVGMNIYIYSNVSPLRWSTSRPRTTMTWSNKAPHKRYDVHRICTQWHS